MKKATLRATAAWQALALLGAGASTAFIAAAPAAAQDYTRGNIVGTVEDASGTPVAGATVTVTNNQQGYSSTTVTDANGNFRVVALASGTYTVIVEKDGQVQVEDRGVTVVAGQNNTFSYIAGEAAVDQQPDGVIVVTGTRIQVDDFASTQTGATIDVQELAETVPVSRNANALIQLAPGTTAGDAGFGNLTSISGATVAENAYYINGLNVTDFRGFLGQSDIPFEFYRTFDVKTGGYPAEYGRALGGVTSAVTKSGSNTLKGGAIITYSPDWLREDSPNTYLSINELDYSMNVGADLYLSGPIIKDRLFFYGIYSPGWFETENTGASSETRTRSTSDDAFWGGKLDAILFDGHRLEFTYFNDKSTVKTAYNTIDLTRATAPAPNTVDPEGGLDYVYNGLGVLRGNVENDDGGDNFIASYTGQFTDWFTLSLAYGENRDVSTQHAVPNIAQGISRIGDCAVLGSCLAAPVYNVYGTVTGDVEDINIRKIYRADADLYLDFMGSHHFRAGFDYEKLFAGEATRYTGDGYRYDFRRNLTLRRLYSNYGEFNTNMRAFYLQDSWSLMNDRINLQLGVRNDRFRNYTKFDELYYDSGDLWAPRLGATIDVFGDKRTKLNVFWGRYFLPIATNTNLRLAGEELYVQQVDFYGTGSIVDADGDGIPDNYIINENGDVTNFDGTGFYGSDCPDAYVALTGKAGEKCAIFADGTLAATDALVSSNLEPSKSDEWLIGLSHRMGDWTFGVDYVNRRLGQTLEDAAIDAGVLAYCDANGVTGCASVWTGFHQYVLINPGSDVTVRLDGDCTIDGQCDVVTLNAEDIGYPEAVRKYDAVQFTIDKAFNGLYQFNANYTYTDLRGNFEGGVKSDNNQTDTGLTQDFDQPGFLDGAFGDLANGRKHSFKFYGYVQPIEWLGISTNIIVESPRKFSCIGNYKNDSSTFEYSYGAASYYCRQAEFGGDGLSSGTAADGAGTGSVLVPRGTAFESQWNKRVDFGLSFDLAPLSLPGSQFRIDVFNIFNWDQKLDFNEFGDVSYGGINESYGRVTGYQAPRSVRFTLAMRFGEDK
ncbi:TonB-dependent receptor [Sphingomicrobium nitratireducens]|uniref:TonB-dependent receptor n=1 Tax=Sphingomicrobium nitratireducens TaxID=2964666 RepID=UPI00223FF42E|nr:TonB-dependent receptor [Sphingomicrobium nitratireducens]